MTSGQLASAAGINKETIRFYERRGLIRNPVRTPGGYRDFDESHLERIIFIKNAQSLGFALTEISELLAIADGEIIDHAQVRAIAERKVTQIDQQTMRLKQLKSVLRDLIGRCHRTGDFDACPIIESLSGVERKSSKGKVR